MCVEYELVDREKILAASYFHLSLSDRKIRVGIAGYGLCRFGSQFGFQNHPNVEVVAVTDLIRV